MIEKDILRQIVRMQQEQGFSIKETVKRDLLPEILRWFDDKRILILTGLRRSGKSTLLKQIMQNKKDFCYVNFEDERFIDFEAKEFEKLNEVLMEFYGDVKTYFFDEIQIINNFESFVRRLQDEGKKIILTGSNASLLSKEFGTKLTGRYKEFEIYPFSFIEFLKFKGTNLKLNKFFSTKEKVEIKHFFQEYFNKGGMPEYLLNNDAEYIRIVYQNIIYRDVIARYSIKRQKSLKELINILMTNNSRTISYNSLKNILKLSNAITVKEYISYLCNSYLFFEVLIFDFSIKRQLNSPKKIYLIDQAFHLVGGLNFSPNSGRILENIVFIELKRKYKEVFYFHEKHECDFVIKKGTKIKEVLQVCYDLNKNNQEREINGIIEAMNKFNLKQGIILTYDQDDEIEIKCKSQGDHPKGRQIIVKPVWKWLLE